MILPQNVWTGLFDDYRNLVKDTTEASDNYNYICFAGIFGSTLGRRIHFCYPIEIFPNYYICLLGPTSIGRKGTAWRIVLVILYEVDPDVLHTYPGSAESLYDSIDGDKKNIYLYLDEMKSLLTKGHYQQVVSNLLPTIASLFNCDPFYPLGTRSHPVIAKDPFTSVFGATTSEWLLSSLDILDIQGGFANRFLFVPGEPKPPIPKPKKIDQVAKQKIVNELKDIQQWADNHFHSNANGEITATDAAWKLFSPYYIQNYEECKKSSSLKSILIRRFHVYVWKFALLYAAMDRSTVIDVKHLQPAIDACTTLEKGARDIFATYAATKAGETELRMLKVLEENNDLMAGRELIRALHISSKQLSEMAEHMEKWNLIETRIDSSKPGPARLMVRRIT